MGRWKPPLSAWGPALLSLGLSLSCLGDRVYWQDSGFYLTAVKEFTALYPPGFVLYLLLCKGWTLLLGFVDFTRAVHLFSAVCGAAAAGVLGVAVRDFLRARSGVLQVLDGETGRAEELCGAGAGALAASGFTFWFSGTYAKGYSFLYLVLALLLWRMVVAAERRRPRDFTIVAALIGLAWQAHPSATGAGLALLLFVGVHAKLLGAKGLAGRTALAAATALGPALLLPWLTSGDATMTFDEPRTLGEIARYAAGSAFTHREGVFGLQGSRWATAAQWFWEEFLGIGLLLLSAGAVRLWGLRRRLLGGLLLWVGLYTTLPTIFILEGQQDHWYVAAWLPLHGLVGLGLHGILRRAGARGPAVAGALVAVGVAWAVAANRKDLDQRTYELAELYGQVNLGPLSPDAVFFATSDESSTIGHYLQQVKGVRPDVIIVRSGHLEDGKGGLSWYDRRLMRRDPRLKAPDYAGVRAKHPRAAREHVIAAAFANANAGPDRAIYFEKPPPADMLRPDYALVPAGPLLKMVPRGKESLDPRAWAFPIEPEAVRQRFGRERGQDLMDTTGPMRSKTESYERRLFVVLLRARFHLADWHFRRGSMQPARDLLESVVRADPDAGGLEEVVFPLAVACAAVGPKDRAERLFRGLVQFASDPGVRARSWFHLGELAAAAGRAEEARSCWRSAAGVAGVLPDPAFRAELERRLQGR